jgi:hypothetical protein
MGEADFGQQFGADGWFVVIGVLAGLAAGLALTGWRRRDPLLVVGLLVVGSCLAAALMAVLGHRLGPGDPGAALRGVQLGAKVPERLDVGPQLPGRPHQGAFPVYLSWPFGALVGAMFVLVARRSDDLEAGFEPGATGGRDADKPDEAPRRDIVGA